MIFLLVVLFIFIGVYGAMCSVSDLDANGYFTKIDQEMKNEYVSAATKYSGTPISVGELEKDHAIPWGLLYSLDMFEAQIKHQSKITIRAKDTGERLAPHFTYKDSTIVIITTDEDGNTDRTVIPVKLLIKAATYKGLYVYTYERVTIHKDSGATIIKDKLVGIDYTEDWARLEAEMKRIGMQVNKLEREMLLEASDGFTKEEIQLSWLYDEGVGRYSGAYIGEIPAEYLQWFKEAEKRYGIPWYILAAIAKKESSFNPEAVGPPNRTGELAQGTMQFLPSTFAEYGVDADGDGEANAFSPKDAIFSAANYLAALQNKYGNIEDTLSQYGGDSSGEYAQIVLGIAEGYKNQAVYKTGEGYIWPLKGQITSPYGEHRNGNPHSGMDIDGVTGDPIVSVIDGTIEVRGWDNSGWFGNQIRIRGVDGNLYLYGHMSKFASGLSTGDFVSQGQLIGYVGNTGNSRGSHLHFGVKMGNKWVDPMLILP